MKPSRVLFDEKTGRTYYIDSMNNAYSDKRFMKRVLCGMGHKMWSSGEFMICEPCIKKLNIPKVKCKIIPFEEESVKDDN